MSFWFPWLAATRPAPKIFFAHRDGSPLAATITTTGGSLISYRQLRSISAAKRSTCSAVVFQEHIQRTSHFSSSQV